MLSRNERIDCKVQALKRFDPEREVQLDDAFTNYVEGILRATRTRECRLEIDEAIEGYEDALNRALYERLEKHIANRGSRLA
jgi:hypothetical protein